MLSLRSRSAAVAAVLLAITWLSVAAAAPAGATGASPPPPRTGNQFNGSIEKIDADLRQRMTGNSWHRGCPVPLRDLRLLTVDHWGFDGEVRRGYMVVNADSASEILRVMRSLHRQKYPIRRMRLVDAYGSDDHRSMNADNTSAFNCREIAGRPGVWSQHAYGRAIDLNPIENPYVTTGGYVSPRAGRPYATRHPRRRGMVSAGGKVVRTFAEVGWGWGGSWYGTKDFQHFSATGS